MKTGFNLRRKKFTLLLLSLLSSLIAGICFIFSSHATYAVEGLNAETLFAQDSKSVVIKNTICVKRWQECKFSLYYMGDYEEVCIAEIQTPVVPTSDVTLKFYEWEQPIDYHSVNASICKTVTEEMEINPKISVEKFLSGAGIKAVSSSAADYAVPVGTDDFFVVHVDGKENPVNKVYGNLLMANSASKYKLVVYKEVRAKHRSWALSKWGAYKVESAKTSEYCFYAFNSVGSTCFYQKTGVFDTMQEYSDFIYNIGK